MESKENGENAEVFCGQPCNERDFMEEMLFKHLIKLDKPVFGICRGLQLFNALLGGTLYQDIPVQLQPEKEVPHKQNPPYDKPVHIVYLEKQSPFDYLCSLLMLAKAKATEYNI